MAGATYEFKVDTKRDGAYGATIDDLTSRLIGQASWNVGMNSVDQDFAAPANLTLNLDNIDGAFNPETLGAELLSNNAFATWSGDNPSSWTVTGETGSNPEISQVEQSELHDGVGTGACNIYSTSSVVSISQTILTAGTTYSVTLTVSASSENTGWIAVYDNTTRISPYYHLAGIYTFYFNATSTTFKIASSGAVNMTVDSVSVKASSLYGQLLAEGTLGRFRATFNAVTYTLFIGRLTAFTPTAGANSRRVVTLTFSDPTLDLLDTEYMPPLFTNVTADEPMTTVFDSPIVPFPYAHSFWILGTQGSSELELTTTLYTPPSYSFDTGKSTYSWVGDNSIDNKDGVSTQSFLRDLVEGEIYGRFFYDPTLPGYRFHNRHRDALNTTVAFTVTENDYESDMSLYSRLPVLNQSRVSYQPRGTGDAASIIWTADEVITLEARETKKITCRYRDLANPSTRIGATDVLQLLAGTDYVVIATDLQLPATHLVYMSIAAGASSAEITIVNESIYNISVTTLNIRGTPLTTYNPRTVERRNYDSTYAYKNTSEQVNYNLIDTDNDAQNIADYRVYKNANPISAFSKLGWIANKTASRMTNALATAIGDRITVSDSWLSHSADYYTVGMRHSVMFGGEHTHSVTLTLKSAAREALWVLDTSLLGISTRLGF